MQSSDSLPDLIREAKSYFTVQYGSQPTWLSIAPGRVNLIGEHTDYNGGFVLPMAIDRYVILAAGPAAEPAAGVTLFSTAYKESARFSPATVGKAGLPTWARYVQGVCALFPSQTDASLSWNGLLHGNLPLGGGLSSSAAVEAATASLLERLTGTELDPLAKALLCQKAEHDYAQVPCGLMDQCAVIMCRRDNALLLDCQSNETRHIPFADPDVAVLIINSNVKHRLADGEYAIRREQCAQSAQILGVKMLRDLTHDQLVQSPSRLGELCFRRCRHVVSENARTLQAVQALEASDWVGLGSLMYESHASLRGDYEVSCPELDVLVSLAQDFKPDEGMYGCRMTGGGFGGCTVSLVRRQAAHHLSQRIVEAFRKHTGIEAAHFITRPVDGVRCVPVCLT